MTPPRSGTSKRRLSTVLRERRHEKGLTLSDVGAELGLANGNFVGMVERGERVPSDTKLLEWARVLELDDRELLELKYREQPDSAVVALFGAARPDLPYVREFLLATCLNRDEMQQEFGRAGRTPIEELIFQHVLELSLLDILLHGRHGMTHLRHRLQEYMRSRRTDPRATADLEWFEDEGPAFVEFASAHVDGWSFDRPSLTLTVHRSRHPGDHFVIPLVEPRLREEVLRIAGGGPGPGGEPGRSAPPGPVAGPPQLAVVPTLRDLLRREGLVDEDVDEILDLIQFKKARRART